jgi:hypothetical protein
MPDVSRGPRNYSLETVQYFKLDVSIRRQSSEFNPSTVRMDFVGDTVAPKNSFPPKSRLSTIPPYLC